MIKDNWALPTGIEDAVGNIVRKLKRLRKVLSNWERRCFGNVSRRKEEILQSIENLEKKQEETVL